MIDVNAVLFRAVAECQSTEEVRFYINGVYIHAHPDKGAVLVATDGHRLVVAHDETGKCAKPATIRVDRKYLAGVKRAKDSEDDPRLIVGKDGRAIVGSYQAASSSIVDGTYPDYAAVIRLVLPLAKKGQFAPATFNQQYITAFGRIAQIINPRDKNAPVRLVAFTENDPALILFNDSCIFGLLMPMRSVEQKAIPSFMRPILEPRPSRKSPAKRRAA